MPRASGDERSDPRLNGLPMETIRLGVIMNGVTGRMGTNQHLVRSICAIRAQGGQSPAFEVQTGSVQVGTREANVAVPKIEVKPGQTQVAVPSVEVRRPEEAQSNAAN